MKLGIISAVENELAPFMDCLELTECKEKARLKIYEGKIGAHHVAMTVCGVCKVNAAMAAQILIDSCDVDAVINAGTAGGMDAALGLFDTVVCTEVGYHDVDFAFLRDYHPHMDSPLFKSSDMLLTAAKAAAEKREAGRVHFGRMMTGETFITDEGRPRLNELYAPMSVDMETAAIAHVCLLNERGFISVRSITDTADHSGIGQFEENCVKAAAASRDFVLAMLGELK